MNIAGLDIATKTGLAVMKDGVITAETFMASVKKKKFLDVEDKKAGIDTEHEGMIGRKFEDHLTCWLLDNDVGYVAIESPINSATTRIKEEINTEALFAGKSVVRKEVGGTDMKAIFRIYGLEFMALAVCSRLNIPSIFVSQGTWRKEFIGIGRAKNAKDLAVQQCRKLGIEISSVDAAEAVGVVTWLDRTLNPYSERRGHDLFANKPAVPTPKELEQKASR